LTFQPPLAPGTTCRSFGFVNGITSCHQIDLGVISMNLNFTQRCRHAERHVDGSYGTARAAQRRSCATSSATRIWTSAPNRGRGATVPSSTASLTKADPGALAAMATCNGRIVAQI
jgi:hypothetical protein